MVQLELLKSTRNVAEFRRARAGLTDLPDCPIGKSEWERALWVYEQLAAQGGAHQRSVQHSDLLIAAAAEAAGIPVVHYDQDFERIAVVTEQPTRWIVKRGSI
jgi:predicted nucleic acid-binding protein